jgi:hypothetical protein
MAGKLKLLRAQRICRLVDLLGLHPQSVAVSTAAKEWGVKPDQIHKAYIQEAREAITADVQQTRTQLVRAHHHRLTSLYHVAETVSEKLAALAQLASLHGLNAPSQVAVTVDVLYNPEEQLRALSDPRMLEKVLALDAEFEEMRVSHADKLSAREAADPGEAGILDHPRLHVSAPPPAPPEGAPRGANGSAPKASDS